MCSNILFAYWLITFNTIINHSKCQSLEVIKLSLSQGSLTDLDEIVKRAVQAAVDTLSVEFNNLLDQKVENINSKQQSLQAENNQLKARMTMLEASVDTLTKQIREQDTLLKTYHDKINEALIWTNRNEQYSRKNNLKLHGLKLKQGEVCRLTVSNMLTEKLHIHLEPGDITVTHPIPRRRQVDGSNEEGNAEERPPPIIVCFSQAGRDKRDEALKRRKQLKNTGFSIFEDMTSMNMKLINRLKNRDDIKNAWFSNGKVFDLLVSGKKMRFQPFDDIDAKLLT